MTNRLVDETLKLVQKERSLLIDVLRNLREIEKQRLYSDYKFKSMHEMCVKFFKYSDDQAYRRIAAARLLRDLPQAETKIESGDLNLTNLSMAQSLFRQEKTMNQNQKLDVLEKISGKSTREAERITISMSSNPTELKPDRVHTVSEDKVEIKFTASRELPNKIEHLKGILAHKYPNIKLGDLFEKLVDQAIENAAPRKSRVIRELLAKTKHCSNCESTYALEIDHIRPRALGGKDDPENLRVLCRSCNQRAAITALGQITMTPYLN